MVNVTVTLIPVCLFCSIIRPDQLNASTPDAVAALQGLPEALAPLENLPDTLADLLAQAPAPPSKNLRSEDSDSIPTVASILSSSPLLVRQASPATVQELLAPLTTVLGNLLRRRPHPTAAPAAAVAPHQEKAVHNDHEHAEPAEALPEGIVADGFFYQGIKANGQPFNEERDEVEALEVHTHDDISPGKFYDDKGDHPYYVVDKPAEGPSRPPMSYFTSGLRSGSADGSAADGSAADGSAEASAAWDEYYASVQDYNRRLKEYNDFYYPYQRTTRNMDVSKSVGATAENKVASVDTKTSTADTIDRILDLDQAGAD